MSGASENGYIVSASDEQGTNFAWHAFDGDANSIWETNPAGNEWIKMQFPNAMVNNRITLTSPAQDPDEMPSSMTLEGSNDDALWTELGAWVNIPIWLVNLTMTFDFENTDEFLYYRLTIVENQGGTKVVMGEMTYEQLIGTSMTGHAYLNLSQEEVIISIADGFSAEGQIDYTLTLPQVDVNVPIASGVNNFIYLNRNINSGAVTFTAKPFPPQYGLYQPSWSPYLPILIRGDGTDGDTNIKDSYGGPVTTSGTVTISTTSPKYGTGSVLFADSGSSLTLPKNRGIWDGPWTIDFWWNPTSTSGFIDLIATTPTYAIYLGYNRTATKLSLYVSSNGTSWNILSNSPGLKDDFQVGTWYYIRMAFLGRRYMVFVDGIKDIEFLTTVTMEEIENFKVGQYAAESNTALGFMDELRIRPATADYHDELVPDVPTEAPPFIKPWIFSVSEMKGWEIEEDQTYTSVQMLCLGEHTSTSLTSFTGSDTTYAYNGIKQISWSTFNPAVDTWIDLPHNIGTDYIVPEITINSKNAVAPYTGSDIIPIRMVGMYSSTSTWGGIPMGVRIDSKNYSIRYPQEASSDYVSAYGGSNALALITGDEINIAGTIQRGF